MGKISFLMCLFAGGLSFLSQRPAFAQAVKFGPYSWLGPNSKNESIQQRILPPKGAARTEVTPGSYEHWLRHLPLKDKGAPLLLFNGRRKPKQGFHEAVIDIDVGESDLQQCADAVIRMRAEYLYSRTPRPEIEFRYTTGDVIPFSRWSLGQRPKVTEFSEHGVRRWRVDWTDGHRTGTDWKNFRSYLNDIFMYAGTASLAQQLPKRPISQVRIGDFYLQGGHPGHAVIIVDLATHPEFGTLALLAQSYMPAQEIHVLKNTVDKEISPWFHVEQHGPIHTPEWTFQADEIYHFK